MWSSQCVCQFLCLFLLNKIFVAPILLFIFPRIVSVQWDFGAIWYVFILFLLGVGASMSFPLPRWKAQGTWTKPGVSARQRRCGGRRRNSSRAYRWPRKRRSKCSPWHWMMMDDGLMMGQFARMLSTLYQTMWLNAILLCTYFFCCHDCSLSLSLFVGISGLTCNLLHHSFFWHAWFSLESPYAFGTRITICQFQVLKLQHNYKSHMLQASKVWVPMSIPNSYIYIYIIVSRINWGD